MSIKLTLRLDESLIKRAKSYARRHGKSVSQIVADYFLLLNQMVSFEETSASLPLTRSLKGVLKKAKLSEKDYHAYLVKKYL